MIVEDERIVSWAMQIQIESWGYDVSSVESRGSDAIASFLNDGPDLVLLDIFLDDRIDGIHVAEEIRKNGTVPFIFITASQDPETFARAKATNPAEILSKPYNEYTLRETIERVLASR